MARDFTSDELNSGDFSVPISEKKSSMTPAGTASIETLSSVFGGGGESVTPAKISVLLITDGAYAATITESSNFGDVTYGGSNGVITVNDNFNSVYVVGAYYAQGTSGVGFYPRRYVTGSSSKALELRLLSDNSVITDWSGTITLCRS